MSEDEDPPSPRAPGIEGAEHDTRSNVVPIDRVRAVMAAPEDVDLPEGLVPPDRPPGEADDGAGRFDGDPGPGDGGGPPDGEAPDPALLRRCLTLPLNDLGNGRRYGLHFGDRVMWVPRVGWFTWDGRVWRIDPDQIAARTFGQRISGLLEAEIPWIALDPWKMDAIARIGALRAQLVAVDPSAPDAKAQRAEIGRQIEAAEEMRKALSDRRAEHRRFAKSTGNTGRIDALLKEGSLALSHELAELDAADLDVNCESGVLRFHRPGDEGADGRYGVRLIPHDPGLRMTKMMPVEWNPAAECPGFDDFLEEVQPDPAMRSFILRWLGLSMTALPVQMLAFWYGSGANGKSVLADLVGRMLDGYGATAKIKSLTGVDRRGGGDATPDLMMLIGARYVRASEPAEGDPLQEALIKELTGGEVMKVRALNQDFVDFRPVFKLTISGNHKPVIRGTDDGIWRRVLLVPWDVQIPEKRREQGLGNRLFETERAGILNRLAEGLVDYLQYGLQVPRQVREATTEFREESDPVGTFLDQCCHVSGEHGDTIGARELGLAFNWWLGDRGESQWSPGTIAKRLKARAGRWKSRSTGRTFVPRKASTMSYDGIRFNDVFGKRWRDLPRDSKGNVLWTRDLDAPRDGGDDVVF